MAGIYFKAKADWAEIQRLKKELDDVKNKLSGMDRAADPKGFKKLENQMKSLTSSYTKANDEYSKTLTNLAKTEGATQKAAAGMSVMESALLRIGGTAVLLGLGDQIIQITGQFEQLNVALETILGSKSRADALMSQIVQYAATTPFQLTDTAQAAKQMLAYGFAAEDVIGNLRMLGNVASGVSAPIGDLVYLYGTLRTQGRAYSRDIMQFTSRGIPIIDELSKVLGVAKEEVQDLVEAGRVGFPEVEKAFSNLTDEGGIFFNLMEKQSQTITGQISNLKDNFDLMLSSVGDANSEMIKGGISGLNTLVANYDKVLDVLEVLAVTYGTYRAALIAVSVIEKYRATSTVVEMVSNGYKMIQVTKQLTFAQWLNVKSQTALNAAMNINPYVAMATVIAALGYGFYKLATQSTLVSESLERLSKAQDDYETDIAKESANIDILFGRLKAAKEGTEGYKKAKDDILKKYGSYLDGLSEEVKALEDVEGAYKAISEAAIQASKDRAIEKSTREAADAYGESLADNLKKIREAFYEKFGELSGEELFQGLKETLEKGTELSPELKAALEEFNSTVITANGTAGQTVAYESNSIEPFINNIKKSKGVLENEIKEINSLFGNIGQTDDDGKKTKDAVKTIQQQIDAVNAAIITAENKLKELRASDSTASAKDIEDQLSTIDTLKKKLELLTGVKKKEIDKQIKNEQDRIKALQDLANKELEINRNLEEAKISVLRDGIQKREQETTLAYKRQLDEIEKNKQEYLKTLNESKGLKSTDSGYITSLPTSVQGLFDQQTDLTTKKYYQDLATITKDAATEIKDIWRDASDEFISDQEMQKRAINDRYNELIKKARELGASDALLSGLDEKRQASLSQVVVVDWIEAFGELDKVSTDALKGMRDKLKEYMSQISGSIPKDELKDIVEAFEKIDNEISVRNPFDSLSKSANELKFQRDKLKALKEQLEQYKEQGAAAELILRVEKQIKDTQEDETEAKSKFNQDVNNAGQSLKKYVGAAQDIIGMLDDMGISVSDSTRKGVEGIGMMVDALAEIDLQKPGTIITGTIKLMAGLVRSISGFFGGGNKAAKDTAELNRISERTQAVYEQINKLLESRIDLIREATGAEAAYLDTLNQQTIEQQKQWQEQRFELLRNNELFGKAGKNNDLSLQEVMDRFGLSGMQEFVDWYNSGGAAELLAEGFNWTNQDSWDQFIQNWNDLTDAEKESAEAAKEAITGISFDDLINGIDDLVSGADTTFSDISESFEDHMRKAILNFVKDKFLTEALKKWYDNFADYYSDGVLTEDEIAKSRAEYEAAISEANNAYNAALDVAGLSNTSSSSESGLTGQISRSITEDTASELVGLWNRTAIDIRGVLEQTIQSGSILIAIEQNTANAVVQLTLAVAELKAINSNTQNSGSRW